MSQLNECWFNFTGELASQAWYNAQLNNADIPPPQPTPIVSPLAFPHFRINLPHASMSSTAQMTQKIMINTAEMRNLSLKNPLIMHGKECFLLVAYFLTAILFLNHISKFVCGNVFLYGNFSYFTANQKIGRYYFYASFYNWSMNILSILWNT